MSDAGDAELWRRSMLAEDERVLDVAAHRQPVDDWSGWAPSADGTSGPGR